MFRYTDMLQGVRIDMNKVHKKIPKSLVQKRLHVAVIIVVYQTQSLKTVFKATE